MSEDKKVLLVPTVLEKEARFAEMQVELELEVQVRVVHKQLERLPPPPAPELPVPAPKSKPTLDSDWLEKTLTSPLRLDRAKPEGEMIKTTKPKPGKSKIDNVLSDLLKKSPKK